ncbi:hypothetical protein EJB05_16726, partial [Eragrostis curvula]
METAAGSRWRPGRATDGSGGGRRAGCGSGRPRADGAAAVELPDKSGRTGTAVLVLPSDDLTRISSTRGEAALSRSTSPLSLPCSPTDGNGAAQSADSDNR